MDGDIRFDKKGDYSPNTASPTGRTSQAHNDVFIVYNKQQVITVRVDSSIPTTGVDNWRDQVINACIDWNRANSRVRLSYTTLSSANITVKSDNGSLSNTTIAQGSFPSGGNAGSTIFINLDFFNNMTVSNGTKEYNMVHEIGHNLGLRHTNWSSVDFDQFGNVITAWGIPGTPTAGANPDPASVMNGGTALFTWNDFSDNDINAIRLMYPEDNNSNRAYDPVYYLFGYSDLSTAFNNDPAGAEDHWLTEGIYEGRVASPIFDMDYYRTSYSDLSNMTRIQAVTHWVTQGSNEGRNSSPVFNVTYYIQNNSDLLQAFGATGYQKAISHYISTGIDEGRMACPTFNPKIYLQKNADVAAAYGSTNYRNALYHWLAFGRAEGRVAL